MHQFEPFNAFRRLRPLIGIPWTADSVSSIWHARVVLGEESTLIGLGTYIWCAIYIWCAKVECEHRKRRPRLQQRCARVRQKEPRQILSTKAKIKSKMTRKTHRNKSWAQPIQKRRQSERCQVLGQGIVYKLMRPLRGKIGKEIHTGAERKCIPSWRGASSADAD